MLTIRAQKLLVGSGTLHDERFFDLVGFLKDSRLMQLDRRPVLANIYVLVAVLS